jgi:hypothetical protein
MRNAVIKPKDRLMSKPLAIMTGAMVPPAPKRTETT